MARFTGIYVPTPHGSVQTGTVNAGASSGEIVLNNRSTFALAVSGQVQVAFGNSGMSAAVAGDFPLWANSTSFFDLGDQFDRFRIFNNGASTITYWVMPFGN